MVKKRGGGDRAATCSFADNIRSIAEAAAISLGAFDEGGITCSTTTSSRYCLSAFFLTPGPGLEPQIVALGAGTKFLSASLIEADAPYGRRVHDCHAEPLARRALLKWLYLQVADFLALESEVTKASSLETELDIECHSVKSMSINKESIGHCQKISPHALSTSNQECVESNTHEGGCVTDHKIQNKDDDGHHDGLHPRHHGLLHRHLFRRQAETGLLELQPGAALHMYCSSCPCGNATLRRWAQAGLGGDASLGAEVSALPIHAWPSEKHPELSLHAVKEGQVQILLKRDPGDLVGSTNEREIIGNDGSSAKSCGQKGLVPPGTVAPGTGTGVILSCSDKMALWQALGLQGALLSRFVAPLRAETITVHRKFSRPHLQRALCCRLRRWPGLPSSAHPTILSSTHQRFYDGTGEGDANEDEESPSFGSGKATCWWAGSNSGAVHLNGRTGLLWEVQELLPSISAVTHKEVEAQISFSIDGEAKIRVETTSHSPISKVAIFEQYEALCCLARIPVLIEEHMVDAPWAHRYRQAKREAGLTYDQARGELLGSPLYFIPAKGTAGHPEGSKLRVSTGYSRKM